MIQKKKNKKIGVILCAMFICLCSILCIIPFNKQEKIEVYADEVVTDVVFESSNFFVPYDTYSINIKSDGSISYSGYLSYAQRVKSVNSDLFSETLFHVKLFSDSDGNLMSTMPFDYFLVDSPSKGDNVGYIIHNSTLFTHGNAFKVSDYVGKQLFFTGGAALSCTEDGNLSVQTFYGITSWMGLDNGFDYTRILKVTISSSENSYGTKYVTISYFDSNDRRIYYNFYSSVTNIAYNDRTYYLNTPTDFTDNEYYNQGYSAGESAGYNTGYSAGEQAGYDTGYNVGHNVGYNSGYIDGFDDSNPYTFLNLLSATIDAPVKYFQSLFNFELLGVNLQGFLTGLFTLCVIVTIIKLCLGG